jgi:hypothetical protein
MHIWYKRQVPNYRDAYLTIARLTYLQVRMRVCTVGSVYGYIAGISAYMYT